MPALDMTSILVLLAVACITVLADSDVARYINQGIQAPMIPSGARLDPINIATVDAKVFTAVTTFYEPLQTNVIAVYNDEMTALMAEGTSITMAGEQLLALSSGVVVIGTGAAAATVTATAWFVLSEH